MFSRESRDVLQGKIDSFDALIAAHPLSSERVTRAYAIIEAHEKGDKEGVDQELAKHGLPGLAELGKIQAQSTISWWKLHRQRNKLTKKMKRLSA